MVGLVLHGVGQPGMGLLLIGVLGLVVLLGGIGLIGLVAHGLFGTPPLARQTLVLATERVAGRAGRKWEHGCPEMLIIGFGVTEVLLSTLVFTCETCGNHATHHLTKQTRKFSLFFIPLFSVGTKYLDSCTALWADHRG